MKNEIKAIMTEAIKSRASDIHFRNGFPPTLRINGSLVPIKGKKMSLQDSSPEIKRLLSTKQFEEFQKSGSIDFALPYDEHNRFRGNLYRQANGVSLNLRLIRDDMLSLEDLGAPEILKTIADTYRQGFFLIVGPTGHGKTTSMAATINYMNQTSERHIITIEDPIEYMFQSDKCMIDQREVGVHASSFSGALRSAMRQDPDVIVVGEMRDYETMQTAITLAETGHLVLSTMHTNNSIQTIDRIIDSFPEQKQKQVRLQLASVLTGVLSQRLIPKASGDGMILAHELLIINDAVRNIIRNEESEQIYNALQGNEKDGMMRLEKSLANLVKSKDITQEQALSYALNREVFESFLKH